MPAHIKKGAITGRPAFTNGGLGLSIGTRVFGGLRHAVSSRAPNISGSSGNSGSSGGETEFIFNNNTIFTIDAQAPEKSITNLILVYQTNGTFEDLKSLTITFEDNSASYLVKITEPTANGQLTKTGTNEYKLKLTYLHSDSFVTINSGDETYYNNNIKGVDYNMIFTSETSCNITRQDIGMYTYSTV